MSLSFIKNYILLAHIACIIQNYDSESFLLIMTDSAKFLCKMCESDAVSITVTDRSNYSLL